MDRPLRLVRAVLAWPVETQHGARRNALVASTDLAARRREADDVEEFLRSLTLRRGRAAGTLDSPTVDRDVI